MLKYAVINRKEFIEGKDFYGWVGVGILEDALGFLGLSRDTSLTDKRCIDAADVLVNLETLSFMDLKAYMNSGVNTSVEYYRWKYDELEQWIADHQHRFKIQKYNL